jgi:hypothetical protein
VGRGGAGSGGGLRSRLNAIASVAGLLKGSGRLDDKPMRFELSFTSAYFLRHAYVAVPFGAARQMIEDRLGKLAAQCR